MRVIAPSPLRVTWDRRLGRDHNPVLTDTSVIILVFAHRESDLKAPTDSNVWHPYFVRLRIRFASHWQYSWSHWAILLADLSFDAQNFTLRLTWPASPEYGSVPAIFEVYFCIESMWLNLCGGNRHRKEDVWWNSIIQLHNCCRSSREHPGPQS